VDHKSFQLVGLITLHGNENKDLQTLYTVVSQTSSKNSHVNGESSDLEKSVCEE